MTYMEQLKIIHDTLADLTSSVDALIMKESRELLPEVAKFIDEYEKEHKDEYPEQFEIGDVVKTDSGDKAIIIAKSFEPGDLYGKQPYYDLLFSDCVIENERASVLTKVGESGINELNKLFKLLE